MKYAKIGASLVSFPLLSAFGATYYYFPELRHNKSQLLKAFTRMLRVGARGAQMAGIYLIGNDPIEKKHRRAACILKEAFLKNAGLYIKFGQLIASLDVLVPDEYREIMVELCERAPESSYEDVKDTIESSFNAPLSEIFKEFNMKPIKSASIAQVHVGILKENNQKVAVKVQHKWLREQSNGDISLVELFITIAERIFPGFHYKWLGEEMRESIPMELDFVNEGKNAERCKRIFENDEQIIAPEIFWKYSNDRVLTMEFMEGFSIGELKELKEAHINLHEVATLLSRTFCKLIFKEGFVHSDPHQGNLYVNNMTNSKGKIVPQLIILDHGIYKVLDDETRISYTKLWKGILLQEEDIIEEAAHELGAGEDYKLLASMLTSRTYDDIMKEGKEMKERLRRWSTPAEKEKLIAMANEFHKKITLILQKINRDLLLLFKTQNFLNTIDNKIGSPIDNYKIMIDYCYEVLYESSWKSLPFYRKWILMCQQLMIHLKLTIYKVWHLAIL